MASRIPSTRRIQYFRVTFSRVFLHFVLLVCLLVWWVFDEWLFPLSYDVAYFGSEAGDRHLSVDDAVPHFGSAEFVAVVDAVGADAFV